MNDFILNAIVQQIAEDAWLDYQDMLESGETEPSDDLKTVFKRGVYHAVAGYVCAMEINRDIVEKASKN